MQIPLDNSPRCEFMEPHADYDFYNSHLASFMHTSQISFHAGPYRALYFERNSPSSLVIT